MLQRERVGYELLAVKAIFGMYWPDLQRCIEVAKKVGFIVWLIWVRFD